MNSSTAALINAIPISQVYRQLTGLDPRRDGPGRWRAKATWRNGDGYNVSLHDGKQAWHDFVYGDSGGTLDLIIRIRGGSRVDALRWISESTGIPLRRFSAAERAQYAERRRQVEKSLSVAKYWRRSAAPLTEEVLAELKAGISGPARKLRPEPGEIFAVERFAARLRGVDGEQLVNEYEHCVHCDPRLTSAMIRVAKVREEAERRALEAYFNMAIERRRI